MDPLLIAAFIGAGAAIAVAFITVRTTRALPSSLRPMPFPNPQQLLRAIGWFFVVLLYVLGAVFLVIAAIGILGGQRVDLSGFLIVLATGAAILVVGFLGQRLLLRRLPQSN